ncbi:transmembrane protein 272-like [Megalops cyprinoides]|uniref:transmembrane protein 272-like n=1 Tax=Megalops cyprinoides TaxID=118141 RepID=UPI001864B858|nr:transmembrane protein 272-like [Megalops cyprinoides]
MEDSRLLQNIRQPPKASTPVLVISKLIVVAIPITQIVLGVTYMNQCTQQTFIPIYLVVMGVCTIALTLLSCLPCAQETEDADQGPFSSLCTAWNSLMSLFIFCWFIAGNVWIYSIYPPNYDNPFELYCNKTLYLFAFWTTTLVYILVGVLMTVGCCVLICMCLFGRGGPGSGYSDDV